MRNLRIQRIVLIVANVLGVLFLAVSLIAGFHTFSLGAPSLVGWSPDTAASVMAGTGTVAAILFAIGQFAALEMTRRSQACLDAARDGIRRAHDVIIADEPTRNIAWVNAARLVRRSLTLSNQIATPDHRETWKLFREEWRIRFLKFIDADLRYYFGVGELVPVEVLNIDQARIDQLATVTHRRRELNIAGLTAEHADTLMIVPRALKTIYDFVREFDGNDDPLDDAPDFDEVDDGQLMRRDHFGLLAYTRLLDRYTFHGGRAVRIQPEEGAD